MLYVAEPGSAHPGVPKRDGASEPLSLSRLIGVVNLRRWSVALLALAFLIAALLYVSLRSDRYTADASLLVYNSKLASTREDALFAESQLDPTFLETQIQILRSDRIALAVIDRLNLVNQEPEEDLLDVRGRIGDLRDAVVASEYWQRFAPAAPDDALPVADVSREKLDTVLRSFRRNLSIDRIGLSYVVEIAYTAGDPFTAARVANEVVKVYLEDQDAARREAAQSASAWLRERISGLGPQARIIAEATPPIEKSNLRGLFILVIALVAGAAAGTLLAFMREFLNGRLRTPEDVVSATGAEALGILPRLRKRRRRRKLPRRGASADTIADDKADPLLSYVLDHPLSLSWHTLSRVGIALGVTKGGERVRLLGITSVLRGEGKTFVAANLARLLASIGYRVLLVDADALDPALSDAFAPDASVGLVDALEAEATDLDGYVRRDPRSGLHFLPIGARSDRYRRSSILWGDAMSALGRSGFRGYDAVIFDLPPMSPTSDVRAAADIVDRLLLVAAWATPTAEQVRVSLEASGVRANKLVGTVLNRVNMRAMKRLASPAGTFFSLAQRKERKIHPIEHPLLLEDSPEPKPASPAKGSAEVLRIT